MQPTEMSVQDPTRTTVTKQNRHSLRRRASAIGPSREQAVDELGTTLGERPGPADRNIPLDDQEFVDDLHFYSREFSLAATPQYFWRFLRLLPESFGIGLGILYIYLINSVGYHFASKESKEVSASDYSEFAIAMFVTSMILMAILIAIIEKATIDAAIHFANDEFQELRKVFWEGLLGMWIVNLLILLPIVYATPYWVWMLNYHEQAGYRIRSYLYRFFWCVAIGQSVLYITAVTQTLIPDSHILPLSGLNILTGALMVYWFCWYHQGGLNGWFEAYLWHQLVRTLIFVPYCLYELKALKLFRLAGGLLDCNPWFFLWESKLFLLGTVAEDISLDVCTYLTVLTKVPSQVASQTAFVTIQSYFYNIGVGFSLVGRSRFAYLHEKSASIKTALRFFCNFFLGLICIAAITGILEYNYVSVFLDTFAGENLLVRHHLGSLLSWYALVLWSDFVGNFMFTMLRCINKLEKAVIINFTTVVALQLISGLVLVLLFNKGIVWILCNFYFMQVLGLLIAMRVLLTYEKPEEPPLKEDKGIYTVLE